MREFVYLDEVCLRSLLASQIGAVTEEISSATAKAEQAEIAGVLSANAGFLKGELDPRYQTSSTQSTQTSRKAIAQSLFKEFRELPNVELLIDSTRPMRRCMTLEDLLASDGTYGVSSSRVSRGSLLEVEVELDVDPVFRLSMLISEVTEIARAYPEAFADSAEALRSAGPVNRVLERLLTGLIPVRGKAIGLSVARVGSEDYIVRDDALPNEPELDLRPLEIVGVTEQVCYWRDIRRVLFSDARFTMLCRVGRDGIHDSWTPVKLADLFKGFVPDLAQQIEDAGRAGLNVLPAQATQTRQQGALVMALESYAESSVEQGNVELAATDVEDIREVIKDSVSLADTAGGQKTAFDAVDGILSRTSQLSLSSRERLELRRRARAVAGLQLFAESDNVFASESVGADSDMQTHALVDTEVVAVYW
jgi:hypothetical protein